MAIPFPGTHPLPSDYEPETRAERMQLEADLEEARTSLESLRSREVELRKGLVLALDSLIYDACRAKHKIETRDFADGVTGLDAKFESMKDAESELVDCVNDIHLAELAVSDMQRYLNDAALWVENGREGGAAA